MSLSKQTKFKRLFSFIFSMLLCMSVFNVLDKNALDAFASVTIQIGNAGTSRFCNVSTAICAYSITSDPDKMIGGISIPSPGVSKFFNYTINDNQYTTKRNATVKFYNKTGNCVETVNFVQDGVVLSLNKTGPISTISYDGDLNGCFVHVTSNCRLIHTGSSSVVVDVSNKSQEGVLMLKDGSEFGRNMEYGKTYTVSVLIEIPTRILTITTKGQANGLTGGGVTFVPKKGARYVKPKTFTWGQQSAKVKMQCKKLFTTYSLIGQVPYPGTEAIYDIVDNKWLAVYQSSITRNYSLSSGLKVKYTSNYSDAQKRIVSGIASLYDLNMNNWVEIGKVTYNENDGTLTYRGYTGYVDPNGNPDAIPSDKLGAAYTFTVTFT